MIHPEDTNRQPASAGHGSPQQPDDPRRRNKTRQKALAALLLVICLVVGGFLIAQNVKSTPPVSSTSSSQSANALPKPWCAASTTLSNNFSGTSISSLATNDVWSAGAQIMHWNGSAWTISFTPTSPQDVLRSVVEIAPDDVWVVGEQQTNGMPSHALTLHWNGKTWQSISSADSAVGGKNALVAVSGISADDVWAAGFSVPLQGPITPLLEHWNGTKWSVIHLSVSASLQFTSVKAFAPNDVWAAGYEYGTHAGKNFTQPATEHWNGTVWKAIVTPDLSASNGGSFYDINGDATNDLWAVGSLNNGSEMLTEHWNGKDWVIFTSPAVFPGNSNWLASVAVGSANNAWTVGRVSDSQGGFQPFIEHWDGQKWQVMQDPTVNAGELDIVTNVGKQLWIVGLPRTSGGHTFIETLCP